MNRRATPQHDGAGLSKAAILRHRYRRSREAGRVFEVEGGNRMGDLLLSNARVLDGRGGIAERATVRLFGGRVAEVARGVDAKPGGPEVVDLSGMTLMPALVDSHVHLSSYPTLPPLLRGEHILVSQVYRCLRKLPSSRSSVIRKPHNDGSLQISCFLCFRGRNGECRGYARGDICGAERRGSISLHAAIVRSTKMRARVSPPLALK